MCLTNEILCFSLCQVNMGENLINSVSQHPILYDKYYNENSAAKSRTYDFLPSRWLTVKVINLITLYVGHGKGHLGSRRNLLDIIHETEMTKSDREVSSSLHFVANWGRGRKWNMALRIICIGPSCNRKIACRISILLRHIFVLSWWELNVAFTKAIKLCWLPFYGQNKQSNEQLTGPWKLHHQWRKA